MNRKLVLGPGGEQLTEMGMVANTPANAGLSTATFTFSGSEQGSDTGSLTVVINPGGSTFCSGVGSYGQSSTVASMAQSLATSLNANCSASALGSALVTAQVTTQITAGDSVTITSTLSGTEANYVLAYGGGHQGMSFSWQSAPSAMTGGATFVGSNGLTWQHTNVWAGGKLLGTYDKTGLHFYLDDPLGTRRAQTDYAGALEQTCSSLPYGDSLACTGGDLQAPTEHHFTGKERDAESGNDYFGARYFASTMGRWLSPDWSAKREPVPYAKLDNPQSLNLYAYVLNNPLVHIDVDGHATWFDPSGKKIGTDGINDGGVVIQNRDAVQFSNDKKNPIIDMSESGTPLYSFSKEDIGAMKQSVIDSNGHGGGDARGGFHEEGFTEDGSGIHKAAPGAAMKPGASEVNLHQSINEGTTLIEHVHPAGSDATFGGTRFDPNPSAGPGHDTGNVAGDQFATTRDAVHVQVNAVNSDAHVYGGTGTRATFSLNQAP